MLRKFKHYATDKIKEFNVSNSVVEIKGEKYKLKPEKIGVVAKGTSWVLYE